VKPTPTLQLNAFMPIYTDEDFTVVTRKHKGTTEVFELWTNRDFNKHTIVSAATPLSRKTYIGPVQVPCWLRTA
jgi:hypothetical protein